MKITGEMWNAFENAAKERISFKAFTDGFSAALAAAPTPPAPEVEPVAWVEVKNAEEGPYEFHGIKLLDSGKHNLYTHPANDGLRKAAEELIAHGESGGAIFDGEKHFDRLREEATKLK